MAAKISSASGNTTLMLTYIATNAKFLETANDFIRGVYQQEDPLVSYNSTTVQFSDMTSQQKANFVFYYVKNHIVQTAKAWNTKRDTDVAKESSLIENENNYELT